MSETKRVWTKAVQKTETDIVMLNVICDAANAISTAAAATAAPASIHVDSLLCIYRSHSVVVREEKVKTEEKSEGIYLASVSLFLSLSLSLHSLQWVFPAL
ncbi:hypothetical protein FNV43_RR02755 [Rhamnella rubrinervis]|uniref:Uncharacterized protein n=1 Tax=Rhamnella rubrinervis TaxID=2594499 RepID=A0A8K0HGQ2_9ROSA|nr:hypothetical protein FNV43_RR02755 [Rhamnella rubrinervis]